MSFMCKVLSVKTATSRREVVIDNFSKSKLPEWSFFDALGKDELEIDFDYDAFVSEYSREPLFGEISCLASHIKIIKNFIDSDEKYLLVLEDDLVVDPYYDFNLPLKLMEECDIEYLKLYARYFVPSKYINSFGRFSVYRAQWPPLGTQAYMFSKAGANKFISYISQKEKIYKPIDVLLDKFNEHFIPPYLLYPFPFLELNYISTIFNQPFKNIKNMERKTTFMSKHIKTLKNFFDKRRLEKSFEPFDAKTESIISEKMGLFLKLQGK